MRFSGKTVLITGGSSGIGLATAKRVAEEGGRVAITGTSQKHLSEAAAALPGEALIIRTDASDVAQAQKLVDQVREQFGEIDGLFLNAGYGRFAPNDNVDPDFYERMMGLNVRGPVMQMSALMPALNDGGAVVLTASVSPYLGQAQGAVYAATKGAVTALARSWAADLAGRNIRVNSIAPGRSRPTSPKGCSSAKRRCSLLPRRSCSGSRSGASEPPRRWRRSPASSSPTTPPTSPAPNISSMAE